MAFTFNLVFRKYRTIQENISSLTLSNIEVNAEEILNILDEEMIYPDRGPSLLDQLLEKTHQLYQAPAFAKLLMVCKIVTSPGPLRHNRGLESSR